MSYKINESYIKEYSQEVSRTICDRFFQQQNSVEGKHLVNLTEIRQVNLFLVKKMYLRWQEEGAALHSPYFNYNAPEVRQTFNKLMNVLSKNINISRSDFEPFLASSLKETIYFLLDPATYFDTLYDSFNGKIYVKNQIVPLKKYFRYHFPLIEKYFEALEEEATKIKPKKAIKVLNKCIDKYPALLSNASEVINEFNAYKEFDFDEAYITQEDIVVEESELEVSAFDLDTEESLQESPIHEGEFDYKDFSDEEEKLGVLEESKESNEESVVPILEEKPEETEKVQEEKVVENEVQLEETKEENNETPLSWNEEEKALEETKDETEEVETKTISSESTESNDLIENSIETEDEKQEDSFNDFLIREEIEEEVEGITKAQVPDPDEENEQYKFSVSENSEEEEPKTILEKLQQSQQNEGNSNTSTASTLFSTEDDEDEEDDDRGYAAITEKLKENEGANRKLLKGNIPLNMKVRYKKELFGDDQVEFDNAIDLIDQCSDYHEAINLLKEKFVTKHSWDFSGESTREFLSMIDNNFH